MKITDEQIKQLKELLSRQEFDRLMATTNDICDFEDVLGEYLDREMGEDDPSELGLELERLYFEIYNQN